MDPLEARKTKEMKIYWEEIETIHLMSNWLEEKNEKRNFIPFMKFDIYDFMLKISFPSIWCGKYTAHL